MRKRTNPLVMVFMIISCIAGYIIAAAVKGMINSSLNGLVFWLVFTLTAGAGTFFSAKILSRNRR